MLRFLGLIVVLIFGAGVWMGYQTCTANPDRAAAAAALESRTGWPVVGSLVAAGAWVGMAVACEG